MQSLRFRIHSVLGYEVDQPGWLLLNVAVARLAGMTILEESLSATAGSELFERSVGPSMRLHVGSTRPGPLEIRYAATVLREVSRTEPPCGGLRESRPDELPTPVLRYLYPSRYCESDLLSRFAGQEFGGMSSGHERVAGICNWIFQHIEYLSGSTDMHSTAVDCFTQRAGVCRDFAHLGIALCRAMGIPARYGSAYAFGLTPPDFHAFFEVWLDGSWWLYDATRMAPQHGFIPVGWGHDASDTSVATLAGGIRFRSMEVSVIHEGSVPVPYAEGPIRLPSEESTE